MQIKSLIIVNVPYINLITFNVGTSFFLMCPAEIRVRLIQPCVLYAVRYGNLFSCPCTIVYVCFVLFCFFVFFFFRYKKLSDYGMISIFLKQPGYGRISNSFSNFFSFSEIRKVLVSCIRKIWNRLNICSPHDSLLTSSFTESSWLTY